MDLCETPEERAIFEKLRNSIGKEFIPHSVEEILQRGDPSRIDCVYF